MCTLAFIPMPGHVLMVSLRDESPLRSKAKPPQLFATESTDMLYPYDSEGGGTWIGANKTGTIVVLLNGAFVKHERQKQYRGSRGLIVNKMLQGKQAVDSWKEMDLTGLEAHTLVVFEQNQLHQLVWDETGKHHIIKDPALPAVWSSATLYEPLTGEVRNQALLQRINGGLPLDRSSILDFFRQYGDKENGFIMNRKELVKTLSMSCLEHTGDQIRFHYHELEEDRLHFSAINIDNHGYV